MSPKARIVKKKPIKNISLSFIGFPLCFVLAFLGFIFCVLSHAMVATKPDDFVITPERDKDKE